MVNTDFTLLWKKFTKGQISKLPVFKSKLTLEVYPYYLINIKDQTQIIKAQINLLHALFNYPNLALSEYEAVISDAKSAEAVLFLLQMAEGVKKIEYAGD